METMIKESQYKDQSAIIFGNGHLSTVFLPNQGAKMASLRELSNDKEYLTQRISDKYRVQKYDGNYLAGENSGFDDAFPTIDQYFYESYPWQGTKLPDHGELWTLNFKWKAEKDKLIFETNGVRLPYHFKKSVSFESENTIVIQYVLTNLSEFDMDFLWSGHMMLNVEEGGQVAIDKNLKTAFITYSKTGLPGKYGDTFIYPDAPCGEGKIFKVDKIRPIEEGDILKFYLMEKATKGYVSLTYPKSSRKIELQYPPDKVPYLALMHNERGSKDIWDCDYYNFFIEPCTAPLDRPDVANLHKCGSILKAKSEFSWYLKISVNQYKLFTN
jgi:hypothetical protein